MLPVVKLNFLAKVALPQFSVKILRKSKESPWHSWMKYTLPESNDHACQHQNILFERSLASKLSNTPKMIFISHLQTLQMLNKAKFHVFIEKFRHWKLKPAPTQNKFLDFLQIPVKNLRISYGATFHSIYFTNTIGWILKFFTTFLQQSSNLSRDSILR